MPLSAAATALRKHLSAHRLMRAGARMVLRTAPGRVDVLGGLVSEAGGTLAQMAVPRRAAVAAQVRDDGVLSLHAAALGGGAGDLQVPVEALGSPSAGECFTGPHAWAAPLAGAWHTLRQGLLRETPGFAGLTLVAGSELAHGAEQAASTALTVAAFQAMLELADVPAPEPVEAALLAHRAQGLFVPTSAHVVDALSCLLADAPPELSEGEASGNPGGAKVLRFSAQPHTFIGPVTLPHELRVMALDTGVRPAGTGTTVAALRLAGAMGLRIIETIYRDLGQRHTPLHGYLANASPSLYRQYFRALLPRRLRGADFLRTYGPLPEKAGSVDPKKLYRVRTAVDHLITEHEHAEQFLQTLEELSDPATARAMSRHERALTQRRAGRLLLASHHSYRLRLELSCPEADFLVDHLMEAGPHKGIFGARITGSGRGGTVVVLMNRSAAATDTLLATISAYQKHTGKNLGVCEAGTSGARRGSASS